MDYASSRHTSNYFNSNCPSPEIKKEKELAERYGLDEVPKNLNQKEISMGRI